MTTISIPSDRVKIVSKALKSNGGYGTKYNVAKLISMAPTWCETYLEEGVTKGFFSKAKVNLSTVYYILPMDK